MASKIKETLLKEIREQANRYEKGKTKRALLEGLYAKIKGYDNDVDIINTVWANRDLPLRMFTEPELKHMPGFNNLLIGEPRTGEVNLEKAFGKGWEEDFENIPYNQIALVAEKNGVDPNELLNYLATEATSRRRKEIAHEGVLGTIMPFLAQRTQEAIERGETPSPADVTLDLGQTVLEATPYGRAAKIVNNPIARNIIGGVISNTAAPLLTEAADAALYDDDKRGKFNIADVGTGTLVNTMGANFLRLGGALLNKVGANKISNVLMNLGNRESREDAAKAVQGMLTNQRAASELAKKYYDVEKGAFKPEYPNIPNELKAKVLAYVDNMDNNAVKEEILKKLYKTNPVTKEQKLAYETYTPEFLDNEIRFMMKDPELSRYISGDHGFYRLPTNAQLSAEEGVKNLITNKLGGYQQEQGKALTKLPFGLGIAIQKSIDESKEEEEYQKAIDDLYNKYKLDMLGGR